MAYFLVELPDDDEGNTYTPVDVAGALAARGWHTARVANISLASRSLASATATGRQAGSTAVRRAFDNLTPVLDVTATFDVEGRTVTWGVKPDGGTRIHVSEVH